LNREDTKGAKNDREGPSRVFLEVIGSHVVDSSIKVHRALGPGLLESAYQACLTHELRNRGFDVACERLIPMVYEGLRLEHGYRIDMIVSEAVIVENKTVSTLLPIHEAQILTYLRLSGLRLGFLLNWNVARMKDGLRRYVHQL
jgi:GxxExxY protein